VIDQARRQALARRIHGSLRHRLWGLQLWQLRLQGARIDRTAHAYGRLFVLGDPRNLTVGAGSTLNQGVFLNARGRLEVGADVHISPYAQLHTSSLHPEAIPRRHVEAPIRVEDHAWIASAAIISAGVTIGKAATVGAGAVVTKDVAPGSFVAGIPARPVRKRDVSQIGSQ